ncbi:uncharacterized protein Z519_06146 [Cladophialophora bantiana CBS 173.52]|uniref:Autophagy-related protein 27 n=1 Tax=Cladophialophora bantiana (strain ATCC 10958 / CBS 173.52 / CDC B-1940 / NIH 8579) TaxID=1442370 RepID=A0A0D2EUL9_CLAB1|nr:uncharacterized protein Z519_06146 [Cladophialophora bantiana CBS 173.52]KIW93541.1 hypothetical protein Z519_06146 [Cladophialophora bantiana CBS 173.52]
MRSSWTRVATLFSALASASLLPTSSSSHPVAKDITTVADPDHLSIHFHAPCQECFDDTNDGVELTLEIDSAEEECSNTPPRLNGLPLIPLNAGNNVANGQIAFTSKPSDGSDERKVNASWESTCLKGEASIISVRFEGIVGSDPFKDTSGFTTSFKQKGKPAVLRLQDKPVAQVSESLCDEWLLSEDQRLSVTATVSDPIPSLDTTLQVEYSRLEELRGEMGTLHEQIASTEAKIMFLLKQEFKACSSVKCLWETAMSEVPAIAKLISSHFSHHRHRPGGCKDGDAQSPCSADDQDSFGVDSSLQGDAPEEGLVADDVEEPVTVSQMPAEPSATSRSPPPATSPPQHDEPEPTPIPDEQNNDRPHFPFTHGDHPPFQPPHGPPPRFRPGHHGPPPWFDPHSHPHGPPPNLEPFANEERRALEYRIGLAILLLVLLVILSGLVIRAIILFRDPRRRAERAARWEERRTKRLYRKAACKHKWRTWWKGFRFRSQGTNDYEEKREMILDREGILEEDDGLQKEIRTLRNASDFVRDLVQAEEGRARSGYRGHCDRDGFEPAELNAGTGSSSLSDIAPSYVTPPPRYEEELEGEIVVVEDFRYTPSNTDDTPESSIIDCSPRLSLETGRSTIVTKDAHE